MAYDEDVANRVREALAHEDVLADERKMFGGLTFMVRGHMTVGIISDELMVRVGEDAHDDALSQPHAREMDFTGKPMTGFVYVAPDGFADDGDLRAWVRRASISPGAFRPSDPACDRRRRRRTRPGTEARRPTPCVASTTNRWGEDRRGARTHGDDAA